MTAPTSPFRPGDLAVVVEPRPVLRVGYPKSYADYVREVETKRADVRALLGLPTNVRAKRHEDRVLKALAFARAGVDGFGGKERTVHLGEPVEKLRDKLVKIVSVRSVQTGNYYPPSGGGPNYFGEYDYEPGGLSERVTRRLARVEANGCTDLEFLVEALRRSTGEELPADDYWPPLPRFAIAGAK